MKCITNALIACSILLFTACQSSSNKEDKNVAAKKSQLEKLKADQAKITTDIVKLEAEIAKLDPSMAKPDNAKLVTFIPLATGQFTHYIDLEGKVISDNISYITPRNGGGQVKAIFVKRGDVIKKGQLILKMDDVIVKKQIDQVNTQLALAKDLLKRRENLWKENIGAEVELISARNTVEQVEKQIALLKEQQNFSSVYSDTEGVIEEMNVRIGEFFTGNPLTGGIKVVNVSDLKVAVNVPENYLGKVSVGNNMKVNVVEVGVIENAKIFNAGKIIDPNTRSFFVEAKLSNNKLFRPNQLATVQIQDYAASNALTIPLATLQTDEKGKFVMVAVTENGKLTAKKKQIVTGELYGDKLEVKGGLSVGDNIIVEGFQGLYEGQSLTSTLK